MPDPVARLREDMAEVANFAHSPGFPARLIRLARIVAAPSEDELAILERTALSYKLEPREQRILAECVLRSLAALAVEGGA